MPPTLATISNTQDCHTFVFYPAKNLPAAVSSSKPTIDIIENNDLLKSKEIKKAIFNKSSSALQKFLQEEKKYGSLF